MSETAQRERPLGDLMTEVAILPTADGLPLDVYRWMLEATLQIEALQDTVAHLQDDR